MKVYGYVRVSRDEDGKKESIETQTKVVIEFAKQSGFLLNEEDVFKDNNISGYTMERPGINMLKKLIENKEVDILFLKDLSRLGRNNPLVLLFISFLEENNVRLILKNDNYDSQNNDDTMIGIHSWINELYIKDLSKKIRSNMLQLQKKGLIINQHYGYLKDPNEKNRLIIDEEVVETIRSIFKMYLQGYGCNKIAQFLNKNQVETPAIHKMVKFGFGWKTNWTQKHLWFATSIKRILRNDAYIGTLRCGLSRAKKMKGKKEKIPIEEQFIHPNFIPAIISKDEFYQVQELFDKRLDNNVRARANNEKIHRFAGILKCEKCGKGFVARSRKTLLGCNITYVCSSYHKFGSICTSHRIMEEDLNEIVLEELKRVLSSSQIKLNDLDENVNKRQNQKRDYDKFVDQIKIKVQRKEDEIKSYSKQLAQGFINENQYIELSQDASSELKSLQSQLKGMEDMVEYHKNEKENIIKSIDIIEEIISKNDLTNTAISILIDKIIISESDEIGEYNRPKVNVQIYWNTPFVNISEEIEK